MKLIPLMSFIEEQWNIGMETPIRYQQTDRARRFCLIKSYADFLLKEIRKGMFVACDEFDNILKEPLRKHYKNYTEEQNEKDWLYDLEKYNKAKELILFKGFTIKNVTEYFPRYSKAIANDDYEFLFVFQKNKKKWELEYEDYLLLADFVQYYRLELTETAIKEIGL